MSEVLSLAQFRERISIIELATANGYTPNKKHWSKKYPVFDNLNSGDRIYILNPDKPSNQGYVNVRDDFDKGTLVDFVRKRLTTDFIQFNRPERSEFSNINAVLYHHLSLPEPQRKQLAEVVNNIPSRKAPVGDGNAFRADLLDIKPLQITDFLLSRGISQATLNHPNFLGTVYNVENKGFMNTAFPYYDHTGTMIGIETRNHNFKQHAENSQKSAGFWHSNPPQKIDQVLITESAIDALSYHQLHQRNNVLYISTGGNLVAEQIRSLQRYVSDLSGAEGAKMLLGFDQDRDGAKYDLRFLIEANKEQLPGASVAATKNNLTLEIPLLSIEMGYTIANIINGLKKYNKPYEQQMEVAVDPALKKDISKMQFYSSIKDDVVILQIPNSYQAIGFFNKELLQGLGIQNKFGVEKAQTKDFNDDLKLGTKINLPNSEKAGLQPKVFKSINILNYLKIKRIAL